MYIICAWWRCWTACSSGAASNNNFEYKTFSQILEYFASGQRPLNQVAEESKIDKRFFRDCDKYVIEDGVLLRESVEQSQWVSQIVTEKFQTDMFRAYHDDLGHQERARTLSLMKRQLFWPGWTLLWGKDQRMWKMHMEKDFTSKSIGLGQHS